MTLPALVHLTQGHVAIVDLADAPLVARYKWQVTKSHRGVNYAVCIRRSGGKSTSVAMHRLIMAASQNQVVDHIDGDGLDNRRENLRLCTIRQNAENRAVYVRKKRAAGGFLGVHKHRQSGLWHARIHAGKPGANGERASISLRTFSTPEEAARIYDAAAVYYFGEFAALNFPGDPLVPFEPHKYGRRATGVDVRNSKLSEEAARDIKFSGDRPAALARKHGVSTQLVWRIRKGLAWSHIK